ncbi:MAG: RimK family alpha-L-glutamate ligase [Clostridiales bacterium]|nr:RimK family alpha-L-glutamate ligase [Clostridiales bacterium]
MAEALLIENAFWRSPATEMLKHSLQANAGKRGLRLQVRTNADFLDRDAFLGLPPAALFWDKDIRLACQLEQAGVRCYNSARAIALCDDKTLTWLHLKGSGVPMPETLLCPLTFPAVGYPWVDFVEQAGQRLGWPMVIKEGCGSFGQQVYLVNDAEEAQAILRRCVGSSLLMQRFIEESAGRDLRIYVVGGKVVGAMERSNARDFRANVTAGGQARPHLPTKQEEALALAACRALKLDFAGVDLLFGRDGPLLCEVNSNAHFKALSELCGCNPADAIIAHLLEELP